MPTRVMVKPIEMRMVDATTGRLATYIKCITCGRIVKKFQRGGKPHSRYNFCSRNCWLEYARKDRIKRICLYCGKEFDLKPSESPKKRKYCSLECAWKSKDRVKNAGRKLGVGLINKIRINCEICNKEVYAYPREFRIKKHFTCSIECKSKLVSILEKGKKLSEEHKRNISSSNKLAYKEGRRDIRGENNPKWKGGITPIRTAIWRSERYKTWRTAVFIRDRHTCQRCGSKRKIEAHHIYSFKNHAELRFEISNGLTLCKSCHSHAKLREEGLFYE